MAVLNEDINKIEEGSALDILYKRLLSGFLNAQEDTLPDYTSSDYVIEKEEDGVLTYVVDEEAINNSIKEQKEIAIKNSAYLFASSIIENGGSGGGSGGDIDDRYVAISGGYMTGKLSSLFGFNAGDNGIKILDVYQTNEEELADRKNIVKINGELHLDSKGLFINENNVMSYGNDGLYINSSSINLNGKVNCTDSISIGDIVIDQSGIHIRNTDNDFEYYHSGNSNKSDVDWTMKNATVAGHLYVSNGTVLKGGLQALDGCALGYGGGNVMLIDEKPCVTLYKGLNISGELQIQDIPVLYKKNSKVVSISAASMDLNLGDNTNQINLQTDIYNNNGNERLLSKYGDGNFPNSFKCGYGLGGSLVETYKNDSEDTGIVVYKCLKFKDKAGPCLLSDGDNIQFKAPFKYIDLDSNEQVISSNTTIAQYIESSSLYAPLNRASSSLSFTTDADFYVFDKPIEGKSSIGISNSKTRLSDKELFFDDSIYWVANTDGVKYYGNSYMVNNIGSVEFSSGFAGSGWQIAKDLLTGNIGATFDELTIRKKMRIYELEVQKQSVTNGSLWVSDACSGDLVEEVS